MARYDHLPIYRSAMQLAVHLENTVRGFPRYVKYTLGSEMRQLSQKIVALVIRANGERDKSAVLIELRETVELLLVQAPVGQQSSCPSGYISA